MDAKGVAEKLAAPFPAGEVKWKPQMVSGGRCLAVAYINARAVMDRLDEVGLENWAEDYQPLEGGAVVCRLSVRLGGEWVTKADIGSESEQPDEGDRRKAAFSDALKRAAVKFGVGRYLYRLPKQWVDYDPHKRQILAIPQLPAWALPPGEAASAPRKEAAAKRPNGRLPADGAELLRRLRDKDALLAKAGACQAGELVEMILRRGREAGHGDDILAWGEAGIRMAAEEARAFERAAEGRRAAKAGA